MISGERIKQARELRGIAQKDFAHALGVSPAYVARLEAGSSKPSDEKLATIALLTGFNPAFFRQESPTELPLGSLWYRARARAAAAEKTMTHRYAQVMFEVAQQLSVRVTEIPLHLPQLADLQTPARTIDTVTDELFDADEIVEIEPISAARVTRAYFELSPATPIDHLIYEIERAGVLVLAMPLAIPHIDAFSLWANGSRHTPVIVVVNGVPGDRLRFTVAHELGHLVMHRAPVGTLTYIEKEANLFASEFLLPEDAMREEIVPPVTLASLARLKARWKVSVQMLVMRARDLRIISEYQYRYMFEQIGAYGWRTREPPNLAITVERPRYIRQVAEMLYGRAIDYQRLSADMRLPVPLLKEILEAYAGEEETVEQSEQDSTGPNNLVPFAQRKRE